MEVAYKHSGPGIASLIVSILAGGGLFVLVIIAGLVENATPGGMDPESIEAVLIGVGMMAAGAAALVSLGLGIAGLVQSQRQRVYPVLGSVLSVGVLLACAGLMLLGLIIG